MATIIGSGLESYLHQQAREKALNRIAEAREEADRILQQAEEQARQIRSQFHAQIEAESLEARRRVLARAHLEAKQTVIRSREALIERIWHEVEARLRNLNDRKQRLASLQNLIADAASNLAGGALEVQINAQDRGLLDEQALGTLREQLGKQYRITDIRLSDTPAPIWGGAIVRRLGSNQLVDNSFDQRFALAQRTRRNQVHHLLTTGEEPPL